MFFAALFAMYFTIRSVDKGEGLPWPGAHLDIALGSINTTVLLLSSVTCQMGVFAVERGQVRRVGPVFRPSKWGLREWYVLHLPHGPVLRLRPGVRVLRPGQGTGPDPVLERLRLGVLPAHRVPRAARHRRAHRVHLPTRPHLRRQDGSPTSNRSARSSCRTTGTSSTSCGSACSPSSTSSTSQGTASELDHRAAQAPGSRLRGPAARARPRRRAVLRRSPVSGGAQAASTTSPTASPRARTCSERTARAATAWMRRASSQAPSLIGAGAAAVDFQMSTGRMPAKERARRARRIR